MSDEMDVADVLDAAADYLRVRGWQQSTFAELLLSLARATTTPHTSESHE